MAWMTAGPCGLSRTTSSEPRRSVRTEDEVPGGIVTDLLNDDGVRQCVQDVLRLDIVA